MSADSVWVIVITLGIAFVLEFAWHRAEIHFRDRAHMAEMAEEVFSTYRCAYKDGAEGKIPAISLDEPMSVPAVFDRAFQ